MTLPGIERIATSARVLRLEDQFSLAVLYLRQGSHGLNQTSVGPETRNMKTIGFWKEAWSLTPMMIFIMAGLAVSVHDFVYLHHEVLQTTASGGAFLIRIRVEEEMLIEEFGDAYLEYRKRTKMVIPYIY